MTLQHQDHIDKFKAWLTDNFPNSKPKQYTFYLPVMDEEEEEQSEEEGCGCANCMDCLGMSENDF